MLEMEVGSSGNGWTSRIIPAIHKRTVSVSETVLIQRHQSEYPAEIAAPSTITVKTSNKMRASEFRHQNALLSHTQGLTADNYKIS